MVVLLPILALLATSSTAEAPDFSGLLSTNVNTIRSCEIVRRTDGDHLVLSMLPHGEGDAIHIDSDFTFPGLDFIFAVRPGKKGRFKITSDTLGSLAQIDIPVRSAIGLRYNRAERIFARSGSYSIYVGFNFRGSDESQIFGACEVAVHVE